MIATAQLLLGSTLTPEQVRPLPRKPARNNTRAAPLATSPRRVRQLLRRAHKHGRGPCLHARTRPPPRSGPCLCDARPSHQTLPQRELSETILESGSSLLSILGDILDFSSLDSDQLQLQSRPLCLRQVGESAHACAPPTDPESAQLTPMPYPARPPPPASCCPPLPRLRRP
jgi:hypothetical protein